MIHKLLLFILLVSLPALSPAQTDSTFALIDTALSQVNQSVADMAFDQDEMATWQGDRWRTSYFTLYHKSPLKLPGHAELTLRELSTSSNDLTGLLAWTGRRIDQPIRRNLIGDPLEKYVRDTDSFPLYSITGKRNVLLGKEHRCLRNQIDMFYRLIDDKTSYFRKAIKPVDKQKYRDQLWQFFIEDSSALVDEVEELQKQVDMGRLVAGAQEISLALERIIDSIRTGCQFPEYVTKINTGHGDIYVGTTGDDSYEFIAAPLLIIDGGGNDTYDFPGRTKDLPVMTIIDLAGNDTYLYGDTAAPGVGGAVLGFSAVIDLEGDDTYSTHHLGLGAAILGVGALIDLQGNDRYEGRFFTQGSGTFGLGVLADSAGDDRYECWMASQGFGNTSGCGVLVDVMGDDEYIARDDTLFSPSSQAGEHNNSLAQGVGFGRRADIFDGHSWAGGHGILCDASGNDSYSAGLFAQGCAYWFAVGSLIDGGGDDRYTGVWYVQGAAAHFAVGYLDDFGGNDSYTAAQNMAVGAGHDFSIGFVNERGGDDVYQVPNLSLGGGNANGIGIFVDHIGNDHYGTKPNSVTLGRANSLNQGIRSVLGCWGVFVDGGGTDEYGETWAGNNRRWIGPPSDTTEVNSRVIGVGIDR